MKALGPLIVVPRVVTVADSLLQPRPAHHAALLARRIPYSASERHLSGTQEHFWFEHVPKQLE